MRSILVGTAGHVDHGKTALVRALTGIDCDRLEEEKRRGITLDLGFAHLAPASPELPELSFVDVPGHERFLHNALAGLGGVRLLLLVVAADEGVKPQTREHLEIADLLEIPRLVVALNKIDAVDAETAELAALELAELLASTRFADAPILPVSAITGEGVPALRATLEREAVALAPPMREHDPARLPIDRAFLVKGQGVVVTGTLVAGAVAAGDELELLPSRLPVRARAVQVHGRPRTASAGERAALQLAGVELAALARGQELAAPQTLRATRRLLISWRMLASSPVALSGPLPVRVHLYASEVVGTARLQGEGELLPGERGLVEIALSAPIVAVRGDRILVRRLSPAATIGGGVVLDPWWRRKRRGDPVARRTALAASDAFALRAWAAESAERGLTAAAVAARTGTSLASASRALDALVGTGQLLPLRPASAGSESSRAPAGEAMRYLVPEVAVALSRAAKAALAAHFAAQPLELGIPKAAAVRLLLPPAARSLAEPWLARLAAEGLIELREGEVRQSGRSVAPAADASPLARAILEQYTLAGLEPPSPGEVARALDAKSQIVEGLVQHLVRRKELVRLPTGLIFSAAAIARLVDDLRSTGWRRFRIAEFKERYRLSRKWTMPILEHLDNLGVTRRVGEERELRPAPKASNDVELNSAS